MLFLSFPFQSTDDKPTAKGVLERRRLINDLLLYYKILNGYCDMILNAAPGFSVTRGSNFKLAKQTCSIDVRKYFIFIAT